MSFKNQALQQVQRLVFVAVFSVLISCNQKQENAANSGNEIVFEQSQPSFVKITKNGANFEYEKSETRFDVLEIFGKEPQKILLSVTQKEKRELSQDENATKQFTVYAKSIEGGNIDWKKDIKAASIDYSDKVLSTLYSTNENEEETFSYFSITSGEKIMDFTYGALKAMIPNTSSRRFFGYFAKDNSLKEEINGDGIFQYASSEKLLQKFSVKSKGAIQIPNYTPDLQVLAMRESGNQLMPDGKTIILMKLNQNYTTENLTGFAFQITYFSADGQTEYKLIFPIENDKIDLKNAIFDRNLFAIKEIS